ncbi:MAG: hypothetical protein ACLRFE_02700, partial [Clostridia bacterium]
VSFRVYSDLSRAMYDKPYANSNNPTLKVYLPLYCENLMYYGMIYGESAVEERTNIWYYCKYTTTGVCGYVYSDACDKMTNIIPNSEKLPYISEPQWHVNTASNQLISIDSKPFKISIVLICIPFVIFIFLLFKLAYTKLQSKKEIDTFNPFE